jgi:hypothetical protein
MKAFLLLLSGLATSCAIPSLEVAPRYAQLSLDGHAGLETGGIGGSADLDQAGLDDSDGTVGARVDLKFGAPHLVVMGQLPSYRGRGDLDVTVSDGTNTIMGGTQVDSQIDLAMYDAALLFDLFPGDTIEIAIGFGAAYLDVDLAFTEVGGSMTEVSSQESLPVPMLAAGASVWIGPVEVSAFAGGLSLSYGGDEITYLDADVNARWKLFGGSELLRGSLVLGYRHTGLDLQYEDSSSNVDVDLAVSGPYVGFELSL